MCSLLLCSLLVLVAATSHAGELRVGAAATVITPEVGTPLAGYYSLRPAEGVLDDLFAKALVFEQDGATAALVALDLLAFSRTTALAAREAIEKETGIPGAHVMLSATHQHTGPVLTRDSPRDDLDGASSAPGTEYTRRLPGLIAQAVREAQAKLAPARALATKTRIENLAYNRRFWMEDGTVAWNPPKLESRIVAPAGPHDPEVGMLHFTTAGKTPAPLAIYVNYAMHPDTTGGRKISADYPGVLARALSLAKGPEMVTLFANGCCGNLNHRNVWWADPQSSPQETARLGNILAGAVCAAFPQLGEIETSAPRIRHAIVRLASVEISEADRVEAREELQRTRAGKGKFMAQVKAFRVLDIDARGGKPWEVEVQVIALGSDVAFVSLPGEIFVELGLAIKAASPFKHTYIAELANGSIGYIPDRKAYAQGNYEPLSARCAAGSGEQLVETAIRLLRELHPQ